MKLLMKKIPPAVPPAAQIHGSEQPPRRRAPGKAAQSSPRCGEKSATSREPGEKCRESRKHTPPSREAFPQLPSSTSILKTETESSAGAAAATRLCPTA